MRRIILPLLVTASLAITLASPGLAFVNPIVDLGTGYALEGTRVVDDNISVAGDTLLIVGHVVGFNDPFDDNPNTIGDVNLEILCDGKSVFSRNGYKPEDDPIDIDIPLNGVNKLTLIVDFGKNGNRMDRISWANAILVKKPGGASKPAAPTD